MYVKYFTSRLLWCSGCWLGSCVVCMRFFVRVLLSSFFNTNLFSLQKMALETKAPQAVEAKTGTF